MFTARTAVVAAALMAAAAPAAPSEDWAEHLDAFIEAARANPAIRGGTWLEMENVLGEWEKIILVFGFADPGDDAACADILAFAAEQNPVRRYRCNPVN